MRALFGTLIFTILVPGTFVLVVPVLIGSLSGSPRSTSIALIGSALMLIGSAMYVWAAGLFVGTGKGTPAPIAPPSEFVAVGPYRYVRNPIYVGELVVVIGIAAFFGSTLVLLYAMALFAALHLIVIAYEEPNLQRRFGSSYEDYKKAVDRWLPLRFILRRGSA